MRVHYHAHLHSPSPSQSDIPTAIQSTVRLFPCGGSKQGVQGKSNSESQPPAKVVGETEQPEGHHSEVWTGTSPPLTLAARNFVHASVSQCCWQERGGPAGGGTQAGQAGPGARAGGSCISAVPTTIAGSRVPETGGADSARCGRRAD